MVCHRTWSNNIFSISIYVVISVLSLLILLTIMSIKVILTLRSELTTYTVKINSITAFATSRLTTPIYMGAGLAELILGRYHYVQWFHSRETPIRASPLLRIE